MLGLLRRAQSLCAEHGGGRLRVRELSMATALWGVTGLTVVLRTPPKGRGKAGAGILEKLEAGSSSLRLLEYC